MRLGATLFILAVGFGFGALMTSVVWRAEESEPQKITLRYRGATVAAGTIRGGELVLDSKRMG